MPGKKMPMWKTLLLGLAVTTSVYLLWILAVTLLTLQGVLPEERAFPLLAVAALCAAMVGGVTAGGNSLGPGGVLANTGEFCLLLILLSLGIWGGCVPRGIFLLIMVLVGGLFAAIMRRKVGKRRGNRLVKSNKKTRLS